MEQYKPPTYIVTVAFIYISIFGVFGTYAQTQDQIYFLEIKREGNNFTLLGMSVIPGSWSPFIYDADYKYEMITFSGESVHSSGFNFPIEVSCHGPPCRGELNASEFVIKTPYVPNVEEIRLLDINNETLLSINTTIFASDRPDLKPRGILQTDQIIIISIVVVVAGLVVYFVLKPRGKGDPFSSLKKKWS